MDTLRATSALRPRARLALLLGLLSACERPPAPAPEPVYVGERTDAGVPLLIRAGQYFPGGQGQKHWGYQRHVTVTAPDGQQWVRETQQGEVLIPEPLPGKYVVRGAQLSAPRWEKAQAREGEDIPLVAWALNVPDGTPVTFEVQHCSVSADEPPFAVVSAAVQAGYARARWRYVQPVGADAGGSFCALGRLGTMESRGRSAVEVVHYPRSDLRGVQQIFKRLEVYEGPAHGQWDAPMQAALTRFQREHEPCFFGIIDAKDLGSCGVTTCLTGGPRRYPPEERARPGPVTRRVLECIANRWLHWE